MTTRFTTHGHSGRIEHPERLASTWRAGFYLEMRGRPGQQTWVHYAVPTPAMLQDSRQRLSGVTIRYQVPGPDASIGAVHVYAGERRIAGYERLRLTSAEWSTHEFPVAFAPSVGSSSTPLADLGVGVSINLQYSQQDPNRPESPFRIRIASVGCVFIRPRS